MSAISTVQIGGVWLTLRDMQASDATHLLGLHQEVFGVPVDARWWAWKYGAGATEGAGEGVGLWHGDSLVAHCGGVPRCFSHQGVPSSDIQIGDVMVAPQWRGLLTRHGAFFHVSNHFYATRLRSGSLGSGFGFPSDRHLRLAVKLGLLMEAGHVLDVHWGTVPPSQQESSEHTGWRTDRLHAHSKRFDKTIDRAWALMRSKTTAFSVGERTSRYVRWRYAMRPNSDVVFLRLRRPWHLRAEGVAVLAPPGPGQRLAQWLDWIGPPEGLAAVCYACRQEAARLGAAGLSAWVSPLVMDRLGPAGVIYQGKAACIGMPVAPNVDATTAASRRWWLMGGDTDFL